LSYTYNSEFHSECELLEPIVNGAGIIYVVDGSCPYSAEYEAEMEILRWTGQPCMVLINPIENNDYTDEWKSALRQYFHVVRVFNAHNKNFERQLHILKLFGELAEVWNEKVTKAIDILTSYRSVLCAEASLSIASLLVEAIPYTVKIPVPQGGPEEIAKIGVKEKYENLVRTEIGIEFDEPDLFNMKKWYFFGLSKKGLIAVGAVTGAGASATAGLGIDAVAGGTSLGGVAAVGSVLGLISRAVGAWYNTDKLGKI
jgi:hypothetical protein